MDDRESPEDGLIMRSQHAAPITEINIILFYFMLPIPVAARSKARVCGRSLAGIEGSNPAGAQMFVSFQCCVLSGRGLCEGADFSCRVVPPSVECLSMIVKPR